MPQLKLNLKQSPKPRSGFGIKTQIVPTGHYKKKKVQNLFKNNDIQQVIESKRSIAESEINMLD